MKRVYIFMMTAVFWAAVPAPAATTNHVYVDANSACGSGCDGTTWAKALPQIPRDGQGHVQLRRDTTYWFAAGSYGYHLIATAPNGTQEIVYKKATPAEHGPSDDGWSDSMGIGQAVFSGIQIWVSHITVDGSTGSAASGHGFRVQGRGGSFVFLPKGGFAHNHVTIRRCEITASSLNPDRGEGGVGVEIHEADDVKIQYCHIHDVICPIFWNLSTNVLAEHNYLARNKSTPVTHSEGVAAHNTSFAVIRHNTFEDIEGTAFIASLTGAVKSWEIYGNLFFYTEGSTRAGTGHGVFTTNVPENSIAGLKIYNNTIANITRGLTARAALVPGRGSDIAIRNNLWYCDKGRACVPADHAVPTGTIDHNWYSSSVGHPESTRVQNGGKTDPFVSIPNKDFRLKTATKPGVTLASPYDGDMCGCRRGGDGNWDRGAFEFGVEAQVPAPKNLGITQ